MATINQRIGVMVGTPTARAFTGRTTELNWSVVVAFGRSWAPCRRSVQIRAASMVTRAFDSDALVIAILSARVLIGFGPNSGGCTSATGRDAPRSVASFSATAFMDAIAASFSCGVFF